jgi:hypothetical protein
MEEHKPLWRAFVKNQEKKIKDGEELLSLINKI